MQIVLHNLVYIKFYTKTVTNINNDTKSLQLLFFSLFSSTFLDFDYLKQIINDFWGA